MSFLNVYDKSKIDFNNLMFNNKRLFAIIIPVMAEQMLNSLMGLMDTMMVSRVGAVAMSAVALSDSITMFVIQVFAALTTGGTIICSHYLGQEDKEGANKAARQIFLLTLALSFTIMTLGIVFRRPMLSLIFGEVEEAVMEESLTYFLVSVISYPCIALFASSSAFFRACGNTGFTMRISLISNVINVVLNAVFIFGLGWGVFGAGLATLISRAFSMAAAHIVLAKPHQEIVLNNYLAIRPNFQLMKKVLAIGVPSGIENGMFQFGKLMIQSSVSTLGTMAIAAQSMTNIFENVNGVAAQGVGIALLTVAGQTFGAKRKEEGKYYIVKMLGIAEIVMIISCLGVYAISDPVMMIAGMEPESIKLAQEMILAITIFKPIFWCTSFTMPQGLRACGDVKFTMCVACLTMWFCRVVLAVFLIRVMGFGPMAVWIGMFADWALRSAIFVTRFLSGKYLKNLNKII